MKVVNSFHVLLVRAQEFLITYNKVFRFILLFFRKQVDYLLFPIIRMGCTLHQHGHSHGGGGGHGHSHGGGHGPERKLTVATKTNGAYSVSKEDLEAAGREVSGSEESSCSSTQESTARVNINVRAAYIHVIGDFLQSVGVFAAAIVIYFQVSI